MFIVSLPRRMAVKYWFPPDTRLPLAHFQWHLLGSMRAIGLGVSTGFDGAGWFVWTVARFFEVRFALVQFVEAATVVEVFLVARFVEARFILETRFILEMRPILEMRRAILDMVPRIEARFVEAAFGRIFFRGGSSGGSSDCSSLAGTSSTDSSKSIWASSSYTGTGSGGSSTSVWVCWTIGSDGSSDITSEITSFFWTDSGDSSGSTWVSSSSWMVNNEPSVSSSSSDTLVSSAAGKFVLGKSVIVSSSFLCSWLFSQLLRIIRIIRIY